MCGNMQIRFLQVFCYSSPSSPPPLFLSRSNLLSKSIWSFFLMLFGSFLISALAASFIVTLISVECSWLGVQLNRDSWLKNGVGVKSVSLRSRPSMKSARVSNPAKSSNFNSSSILKKGAVESYIYTYTHISFFLWNAPLKTNVSFSFIHSLFRGSTVCVSTPTFACCLVDFLSACVRVWRMDVYFRGVSPCTFDLEIPHERHIRKSLQGFLMSLRNFAVRHSKIWNLRSK